MAKWYFQIDGEQFGPVEADVLRRIAASGRLKPNDNVRREDMPQWYVAKNVTGLFTAVMSENSATTKQVSKPKPLQEREFSTWEMFTHPWRKFKNPWAKAAVFVTSCAIVIPVSKWAGGSLGRQMAEQKVASETATAPSVDLPPLNERNEIQPSATPPVPVANDDQVSSSIPVPVVNDDKQSSSSPPIPESFTSVQLDHGISLSIPTSWNIFGTEWNDLIRQTAQARRGDISGMSEGNLERTTILRMTCNPKHLYGSLTINVYHKPLLPPEDIKELAKSPKLLQELKEALVKESVGSSITIVGESDISVLRMAGHPAVRFSYHRQGIGDKFVVQVHMSRIFLADKTYSVMASYRLIEKELLAPILDACVESISFEGVNSTERQLRPLPQLANSASLTLDTIDRTLTEVSKSLNEGLPTQIDKDTRLDHTTAGPGNRLTYNYTMVNYTVSGIDQSKFIEVMKPRLIETYRCNPGMADFRELKTELHYTYRDKDENPIATIIVSSKEL